MENPWKSLNIHHETIKPDPFLHKPWPFQIFPSIIPRRSFSQDGSQWSLCQRKHRLLQLWPEKSSWCFHSIAKHSKTKVQKTQQLASINFRASNYNELYPIVKKTHPISLSDHPIPIPHGWCIRDHPLQMDDDWGYPILWNLRNWSGKMLEDDVPLLMFWHRHMSSPNYQKWIFRKFPRGKNQFWISSGSIWLFGVRPCEENISSPSPCNAWFSLGVWFSIECGSYEIHWYPMYNSDVNGQ